MLKLQKDPVKKSTRGYVGDCHFKYTGKNFGTAKTKNFQKSTIAARKWEKIGLRFKIFPGTPLTTTKNVTKNFDL